MSPNKNDLLCGMVSIETCFNVCLYANIPRFTFLKITLAYFHLVLLILDAHRVISMTCQEVF